jgi:uroporphyrinogen decarboxylase
VFKPASEYDLEADMTKREVVRMAIEGRKPAYVPWSIGLTQEAKAALAAHYGGHAALKRRMDNHILGFGSGLGFFTDLGNDRVLDHFGVTWNRSQDKDIGVVEGLVLPAAELGAYKFPDPSDARYFADMATSFSGSTVPDGYRVYHIGFSLYERAWTLRGMENLLMDFMVNPEFVRTLLGGIADFNIAVVNRALAWDIDAVYFGDDWGQQHGLIMGPKLWKEFIYPELRRMYAAVRRAGKVVFIHSCGDVDELFDDLIDIGLGCFNPFQPEVMDVEALLPAYRGRLAFHGGLSTQRTLPYGTVDAVHRETRKLLELGKDGGYIFAPAHAVEGDVPVENLVAMLDELRRY